MRKSQKGFTIMELMIAITILAIILLIASEVLTGIGGLFAKGVNFSNVQENTRSLVSDIVSTIQFSGSPLNNGQSSEVPPDPDEPTGAAAWPYHGITHPPTYAYCFGSTRYSFVLGLQPSGSSTNVLWKDKMQRSGSCSPLNIDPGTGSLPNCSRNPNCVPSQPGSGAEMVGPNTSIATFEIKQYNPQLYGVQLGLAFGRNDMFESNAFGPVISHGNFICSAGAGQQYCATSTLATLASEDVTQQ